MAKAGKAKAIQAMRLLLAHTRAVVTVEGGRSYSPREGAAAAVRSLTKAGYKAAKVTVMHGGEERLGIVAWVPEQ